MRFRKNAFLTTVTLLILTTISLAGYAQDKSTTRYPGEIHSYYQEYPIPNINPVTSVILLESDFSNINGGPDWNGWSRHDMTGNEESYWQVSTFNAGNLGGSGNQAWWCGKVFPDDCGTGDFNGYGNYWDTDLIWEGPTPAPDVQHTVIVRADLNLDTEDGFDFLSLGYQGDSGFVSVATFTGSLSNEQVEIDFLILPFELYENLILVWRFESDGATSDEDCDGPSLGAAQIDNIEVILDGAPVGFEDNEGSENEWMEDWQNCGNFVYIHYDLNDYDFNASNYSHQVAFLDDDWAVPGTGGSDCITWCYGTNGYIVSTTGGYCGPEGAINVEIWSPIMPTDEVPFDPVDFHLSFDVYRHEPLAADSPGIFYYWAVRSLDSAGVTTRPWEHGKHYYGEPKYIRHHHDLTALIEPGAENIQVALGIIDLGHVWGWLGNDGTPAPYFDNVSLIADWGGGLKLEADEPDLAQDNFPSQGFIDYSDLGSNYISVDAARNIAAPEDLLNLPQDALICRAFSFPTPLSGPPELHYSVGPNPLFNSFRLATTGSIVGLPVPGSQDRFAFDLPDVGLMYPGDILHYYITATNDDGKTVNIPSDLSGYGVFPGDLNYVLLQYPSKYTMRGLPTMISATPGDQPKILFWNDFGNRGDEGKWIHALEDAGYTLGVKYDTYYTNHPSSALGNGLGGRASSLSLDGYETILYSCGDLGVFTLSNGDFVTDAGDDLGALVDWIQLGDKNLLLTGSNLYFDLMNNVGPEGESFAADWLGIDLIQQSLKPLVHGQSMPGVSAISGNQVFVNFLEWAVGPGPTGDPLTFINAIETKGVAVRCAEFTDRSGNTGVFPYPAATNFERDEHLYKNVCLPYDLMDIAYPIAKAEKSTAARTKVLEEILYYFGHFPSHTGNPPDALLCEASRLLPGTPVSVYNVPNGLGDPLSNCFLYPDTPSSAQRVDSTISLLVKDANDRPVPSVPREDMWLETSEGGLALCGPAATAADYPTDVNGRTVFSQRTYPCGGHADPDGSEVLQVKVNNEVVPGADFLIYFNSPDINGDCTVNLTDVSLFTGDFYSGYHYRSDFYTDHTINLIDIGQLASAIGASSAKKIGATESEEARYSSDGKLGLYADPEGSQNSLEIPTNTPFDLYLIMTGSISGMGTRGWECRVEVPDNVEIKEWRLIGKALNVMESPEFMVGMAEALPTSDSTVLAVARCVALDESPALFRLLPSRVSSLKPALPVIAIGDNETIDRLANLQVGYGDPEGPVFGVNVGGSLPEYFGDPSRYVLHPNSPNPFNPQTEIRFDIPQDGPVELTVYGLDGRRVTTLVSGFITKGSHVVIWNGEDDQNRAVASGVYLCRMEASGFVQTRRMVLLK